MTDLQIENKNEEIREDKVDLTKNYSMTYEEISTALGITVREVKEAEASALRKLRHPKVGKKIKEYMNL